MKGRTNNGVVHVPYGRAMSRNMKARRESLADEESNPMNGRCVHADDFQRTN